MTTVQDYMKLLSFGPLSNLSMAEVDGVPGGGEIAEGSQGKIISYLNQGLLRLYTRFILLEKSIIIDVSPGRTNYYLLRRFAVSNTANTPDDPRYIKDALNPFQEDYIKPLEVFRSDGQQLPINDVDDYTSVFTPQPNCIQVPNIPSAYSISINYQACHPKLEFGVVGAPIYLPEVLQEALLSFVAYRTYSAINTQEATAKAQEHLASFEVSCKSVEEKDLVNSSMSSSGIKFAERGFK